MNIAVIGSGLQSHVTAALFASVGNQIVLFTEKNLSKSFMKEPGLKHLFKEQEEAGRLIYMDSREKTSFSQETQGYDFVLMADGVSQGVVTNFLDDLIPLIKSHTCFIILTPSEIGEARNLSKLLKSSDLSVSVCCVPLLLREGRAITDFSRPESIIIGCDDDEILPKIKALFYPFNRVKDVVKEVSTKEAEFSSFAGNAMLATRLSFMNEIASLAEKSGVDIDVIRECIGSDPRIGRDYLYPGCGYGGKALAENVEKVAQALRSRSDDLGLLDVVARINERQKDLLFRKIWRFFKADLKNKTIAIWGVSFKPGSANIDGAPAVKLIESLISQSANVTVYDPMADDNLRRYFGEEKVTIVEKSYDALNDADVLAICTEWKEFWTPDLDKLKASLKYQAIFDGRNILESKQVNAKGIKYFGIGRGEVV